MKLSRHISIVLAVLILASNIGLAFNIHYCGDSVSAVSLAYENADPGNDHHKEAGKHKHMDKDMPCCTASDAGHESCCDDNFVKLEDNSEAKLIVKSLQLELGTLCNVADWSPVRPFIVSDIQVQDNPSFYCESNAPPLFKLYCRYILYA